MKGRFIQEGWAYEITENPDAPWSNVLTNGKFGSVWTEKGGAFAWCGNSVMDRLTLWNQDLVLNPSKRSVYLLGDNKIIRTLTPSPINGNAKWKVIHGIGWTSYISKCDKVETQLDVMVVPNLQAELWFVKVNFLKDPPKKVRLCSFQDIMLGTWSEAHREFHRLFIDTDIKEDSILTYTKRLDTRPGKAEHWNTPFPGAMACGCNKPLAGYHTDRNSFYGYGGSESDPKALKEKPKKDQLGSWGDPMAGIDIILEPKNNQVEAVFSTAFGDSVKEAVEVCKQSLNISKDELFNKVRDFWKKQFGNLHIKTPMEELNVSFLWLRYQAIASRIMARCALYQASGAFGYRDQLQDSLLFLSTDPKRTLNQLELHLKHQYQDGSVLHWWHPETETGMRNNCSDDFLWPIMAAAEYYNETGNTKFLDKKIPFIDGGEATIWEHLNRSINRSWENRSKRGVPLLGECDWNDGISSAGDKDKGESFWVAHFLHKLLLDMLVMAEARKEDSSQYIDKAEILKEIVNTLGWDGKWYIQATTDEGEVLGSSKSLEGKIHLNPQIWSIISGTATGKYSNHATKAMEAVLEHLKVEWGTLLLAPAYTIPDKNIGYITRYSPGRRENGGVYTHAAVWAGRAARILGDSKLVQDFLFCLLPPIRGKDPRYKAEPYVTPGNIDGPITPTPGKGGWTWYSGSAAWLFRCLLEDLLGIRTHPNGLIIKPNVPKEWKQFSITRSFRGKNLNIICKKSDSTHITLRDPISNKTEEFDGTLLPIHILSSFDNKNIDVEVNYAISSKKFDDKKIKSSATK